MGDGLDDSGQQKTFRTDARGNVRAAPWRLLRKVNLIAYWAANPEATQLDVTVDPENPTSNLDAAAGIISAQDGDVELLMVGSVTPSVLTLSSMARSRIVGFTAILKAGTTVGEVEVGWC